jgi:hypothetical protein
VEPAHTLTIHELAPLLAYKDHDATDMKARIKKLQLTYLAGYKWTFQRALSNV